MSRDNLRPAFRSMPRIVLLFLVVVIGLPLHLAVAVWLGLRDGVKDWWSEVQEAWSVDHRQPLTEELVRSRIRQNRDRK